MSFSMNKLPAHHPWQLVLGLVVWSAWFVAVYAGLSVACAVAPPTPQRGAFTWVNASLLALTLVTALGLAGAARACARAARRIPSMTVVAAAALASAPPEDAVAPDGVPRRFIAGTASVLYAVSAASTVFVGLPLLALWPCV
jgi:hypothetical protein